MLKVNAFQPEQAEAEAAIVRALVHHEWHARRSDRQDDDVRDDADVQVDLADQDQIKAAPSRRLDEPVVKGLERMQGHAGDDRLAGLFPALALPPVVVELFHRGLQSNSDAIAAELGNLAERQGEVELLLRLAARVGARELEIGGEVLALDDLANGFLLGNAVRGLMPARLMQ